MGSLEPRFRTVPRMVDLFLQYLDLRNCTYDGGLNSNPCGAAEPALAPGLNAAPCPMELKSLSLCQPSPDWAYDFDLQCSVYEKGAL